MQATLRAAAAFRKVIVYEKTSARKEGRKCKRERTPTKVFVMQASSPERRHNDNKTPAPLTCTHTCNKHEPGNPTGHARNHFIVDLNVLLGAQKLVIAPSSKKTLFFETVAITKREQQFKGANGLESPWTPRSRSNVTRSARLKPQRPPSTPTVLPNPGSKRDREISGTVAINGALRICKECRYRCDQRSSENAKP